MAGLPVPSIIRLTKFKPTLGGVPMRTNDCKAFDGSADYDVVGRITFVILILSNGTVTFRVGCKRCGDTHCFYASHSEVRLDDTVVPFVAFWGWFTRKKALEMRSNSSVPKADVADAEEKRCELINLK